VTTAKKLGNRVRMIREARGLTQEDLAEKSETSSQYISSLERGLRNVTLQMLDNIANGLQVDLLNLFAFDSTSTNVSKQSLKKLIDHAKEQDTQKIAMILTILLN
jgi:transcriptional regulator with XRE-family HTH domain